MGDEHAWYEGEDSHVQRLELDQVDSFLVGDHRRKQLVGVVELAKFYPELEETYGPVKITTTVEATTVQVVFINNSTDLDEFRALLKEDEWSLTGYYVIPAEAAEPAFLA